MKLNVKMLLAQAEDIKLHQRELVRNVLTSKLFLEIERAVTIQFVVLAKELWRMELVKDAQPTSDLLRINWAVFKITVIQWHRSLTLKVIAFTVHITQDLKLMVSVQLMSASQERSWSKMVHALHVEIMKSSLVKTKNVAQDQDANHVKRLRRMEHVLIALLTPNF
jgi:hypothetical protein